MPDAHAAPTRRARRPGASVHRPAGLLLAALAGCATVRPPALWGERGEEYVRLAFDTAGVQALHLAGGAGRARIAARASDSVRVTVALRSTDERRLRELCLPTATLDSGRAAGVLRLAVRQPNRDRCGEEWTIEMPARLAARVEFAAADVVVEGLAGGLHARVTGAGDVEGTVERGPVDVEVNVGDVRIASRAERHGEVELRSDVGGVALWLLGHRVSPEGRPGAGDRVRVRGSEGDPVTLRSHVGQVRACLGGGGECPPG
jgi:hypothetical protein